MANEELVVVARRHPLLWRTGRSRPRNLALEGGATYPLDPVRRNDGATGLLEGRYPGRQGKQGMIRRWPHLLPHYALFIAAMEIIAVLLHSGP